LGLKVGEAMNQDGPGQLTSVVPVEERIDLAQGSSPPLLNLGAPCSRPDVSVWACTHVDMVTRLHVCLFASYLIDRPLVSTTNMLA
jgi:hypothetical protein